MRSSKTFENEATTLYVKIIKSDFSMRLYVVIIKFKVPSFSFELWALAMKTTVVSQRE